MKALLERRPIVEQLSVDSETEKLLISALAGEGLEEVERVLGYSHPSLVSTREDLVDKKKEKPLGKVLKNIGIKPFTQKSVDQYMEEKAWEFRLTSVGLSTPFFFIGVIAGVIINSSYLGLAGFSIWLASFIASIGIGGSEEKNKERGLKIPNGALYRIVKYMVFLVSGTILALVAEKITGPASKEWKRVPLKGYRRFVPKSAVLTALEIKTRCPNADVLVEELVKSDVVTKDPFLIVSLGDEEYYVEVWNEKGFVGERSG